MYDVPHPDGLVEESKALTIKYHVSDKDIVVMREKYTGLTIKDNKSYETVRLAIADCRTTRVAIEKRRLELNADAQKHIKAVNGAAKVMTNAIEQIEDPLQLLKDAEDNRKAKEKADKEAAERAKVEAEIKAKREAEEAELKAKRDAEELRLKAENERIAKENEALRAERDRLEAERLKLEADRREIEAAKQKKMAKGKKQPQPIMLSAADALARLMNMVDNNCKTLTLSQYEEAAIKRIIDYVAELENRLAKVEG